MAKIQKWPVNIDQESPTTFLTPSGVALAAIQGLNLKLEANLEEKQAEIDSLREQFASLEQRLLAMEASMN